MCTRAYTSSFASLHGVNPRACSERCIQYRHGKPILVPICEQGNNRFGELGKDGARVSDLKDIDAILNTFQSYGHTEVSASYSSHFLSDTLDIYAD